MQKEFRITPPFFEIGPKAYLYGTASVELAKKADIIGEKYDVDIIYTPQYTDIRTIVAETNYIYIFAQHMDPIKPGRGIGAVLPEAIKEAGADGVLLNHAEKRMTLSDINSSIKRADEVGLATLVCADTPEEALAIAHLSPNIILAEPPGLIGASGGDIKGRRYVSEINARVKEINPEIHVLHSAGIVTGKDVYEIMSIGAEATGCTSGIIKAPDPCKAMEEMIKAARNAWNDANK